MCKLMCQRGNSNQTKPKIKLCLFILNIYLDLKNKKRSDQECDYVTVIGTRDKIEEAREALKQMNDDMDKHNFTVELAEGINISELIPQLRGRNGAEAEKLSKKFDVRLDFSKKGEPDKIVIRGLKENVEACETHLRKKIEDEEAKLSSEIAIDSRVHSRIIGGQGKALAKIQEKFKV
jgi:rRNA processing protein Krr1/Pno1